MSDILFLAHRIPFPPDRGDKIRSHHLLKALAQLAPVHVGCFGETAGDFACENMLAQFAASHCLVRRSRHLAVAGLRALGSGRPVSLAAFDDGELRRWVAGTLRDRNIDTVFVFSGQMGQYVPANFAGRLVIDLCDVDSAKFAAYAAARRWPRGWIDAREAALLADEESRLALRADCTLLVSDEEAALFRSRCNGPARVVTVRNGIDSRFFHPRSVAPHPQLASQAGPHLVFTGQMDYAPNVAAASRMAARILPRIRQRHPEAVFHIVGRAPVAQLQRLDGSGGVRVWGQVPDVRPFLAGADVAVAPLAIARGIQNKVLEAMAMARPVVLSPEAAIGIDATDAEHFAIAPDDGAFASRALDLIGDRRRADEMAMAARRFVVERQGWDAMLAPLADLVGRPHAPAARDAA